MYLVIVDIGCLVSAIILRLEIYELVFEEACLKYKGALAD